MALSQLAKEVAGVVVSVIPDWPKVIREARAKGLTRRDIERFVISRTTPGLTRDGLLLVLDHEFDERN